MNKHDSLNTEELLEESEAQKALRKSETELKRKTFVEPSISEPLDVFKATAFFFQAPGDSGDF